MLRVAITVRPQRADVLCQRLLASAMIEGLTAEECRGYGRQKGHLEQYAGDEYQIDFLPKVRIDGVIQVADRDRLIDLVCSVTRTGRIGDGKIFFQPIEQAIEL